MHRVARTAPLAVRAGPAPTLDPRIRSHEALGNHRPGRRPRARRPGQLRPGGAGRPQRADRVHQAAARPATDTRSCTCEARPAAPAWARSRRRSRLPTRRTGIRPGRPITPRTPPTGTPAPDPSDGQDTPKEHVMPHLSRVTDLRLPLSRLRWRRAPASAEEPASGSSTFGSATRASTARPAKPPLPRPRPIQEPSP